MKLDRCLSSIVVSHGQRLINIPSNNKQLHLMRQDNNVEIRNLCKGLFKVPTKNEFIESIRTNLAKQQYIDSKKYSWAATIANLLQALNAQYLLEIGTCIGVSSAYIALQNRRLNIDTIEMDKQLCRDAQYNFEFLNINNRIKIYQGTYQEIIPKLNLYNYDVIFKDAYHIGQANIDLITDLKKIGWEGIVIFDDIRWSWDMYKAWKQIKTTPGISTSIDLYHIGIVLMKNYYNEKNHYKFSLKGLIPN